MSGDSWMSSAVQVELFAEDQGHEAFIRAVLHRIAREKGQRIELQVRSARGGHGRAIAEFSLYQKTLLRGRGAAGLPLPDFIVVAIDANCQRFQAARSGVLGAVELSLQPRVVPACPDPHVEVWYLADPVGFRRAVGSTPRVGKKKCERDRYKNILSRAVSDAGHPTTLGGIEFARAVVEEMDFFAAGKFSPSLKHFLGEVSGRIAAP